MRLILFFLLGSLSLAADEQPNILVYGEGNTQVNAEIDEYETLKAGDPIEGSIMITHEAPIKVDENSFYIGDKPLKVSLEKAQPISTYSSLKVTVYRFELPGMKAGFHTLPPIKVKIGSKEYRAAPLTLQID